ncbi:hypothetical protein FQA39_LY03460 [Lamprigera yunnana]|nr:hypothetical protein FQA39_LY03460 [Lamprigera yunnana]
MSTRDTENSSELKKGFKAKLKFILSNITIEPVLILFLLPSVLLALSMANLGLEKACRVKLQLNDSVCDGLAIRNNSMYTEEQENLVQKEVASVNAWKSIIQSVIPAVLLLSFGAWSDKRRKRKPFLILPLVGEIIMVIGLLLCAYFFYEFSLEVTGVFETLPVALCGGWFTMFMALYSYVSDNSTVESRTVRIGVVNLCNTATVMLGIALSGILYRFIGLYPIFSTSLVMYLVNLLYVIFLVKEEKFEPPNGENSKYAFITDFFNIHYIKSTFEVAYRAREKNYRKRILLSFLLVVLIVGPLQGELNVIYLFTRKQFLWSEIEFSTFYTINFVFHLIGTIFSLTVLSKYFKLDDAVLGIISGTGKFFSAFVFAFAPNETVFYLGIGVEMLSGTSFIALRSITSKLVPADELGKLNALTGICEAFMPLAYGSMYNLVYKSTIDGLPGTFYLLGGVLSVPTVLLFVWFYIQHRQDLNEQKERERMARLLESTSSNV